MDGNPAALALAISQRAANPSASPAYAPRAPSNIGRNKSGAFNQASGRDLFQQLREGLFSRPMRRRHSAKIDRRPLYRG
jgi:hypothetical protein